MLASELIDVITIATPDSVLSDPVVDAIEARGNARVDLPLLRK